MGGIYDFENSVVKGRKRRGCAFEAVRGGWRQGVCAPWGSHIGCGVAAAALLSSAECLLAKPAFHREAALEMEQTEFIGAACLVGLKITAWKKQKGSLHVLEPWQGKFIQGGKNIFLSGTHWRDGSEQSRRWKRRWRSRKREYGSCLIRFVFVTDWF